MPEFHQPVLLDESVGLLEPKPGEIFVDATVGGGGHAEKILEKIAPEGCLIGIDRNPDAIAYSAVRLGRFGNSVRLVKANYRDIELVVKAQGWERVDGVILDLGVSSHELEKGIGFSFQRDEPLDMRMDPAEDIPTARHIVNEYRESELAGLIRRYGEERYARQIAAAIVRRRAVRPIETTFELLDAVGSAVASRYRGQKIHFATRTWQAIRIAVNRELEALEAGLNGAIRLLRAGGRICVISFHSLEDRAVKTAFRKFSGKCVCPPELPECRCGAASVLKVVTAKPVTAGRDEVRRNPRSRSAKLRFAVKTAE